MELSAPCPPLPGRPFFVEYEGGKVYTSTHDRFHLDQERRFKQILRVKHPDRNKRRGQGKEVTIIILKSRGAWRRKEVMWYARFGLEPPEKGRIGCKERPTGRTLPD